MEPPPNEKKIKHKQSLGKGKACDEQIFQVVFLTLWFGQREMEPSEEIGYQSLPGSLGPGAAQLLTNQSVVIQTNAFTSSGPNQSYYQPGSATVALYDLHFSLNHPPMLLCYMASFCECICVENMMAKIKNIFNFIV